MDHILKTIGLGTTREDLFSICNQLELPFFKGIYPCDLVPNLKELGETFSIIINTHPSTLWGEHWVLLLQHQNVLKISDSLKLPKKMFESRLGEIIKHHKIGGLRKHKVQHKQSWNCGLFVLHDMFLFHLKINRKYPPKRRTNFKKYQTRACKQNDKICIYNISKMLPLI